ncbi:MAG: hypothetical protein P4L45_12615 [Ignavibacteriaceae bacterium]|nr:hypothetical protein [Ignavibacteriaceae bacterium]
MKSYKVRFTDGKTISVISDEKITIKKLSSNFLSFDGSNDNINKVYINTNYVVSIEEHKTTKSLKEKKPKEISENKDNTILP